MKAFLTGSRVYGKPHAESDTDLVVFMDEEDKEKLYSIEKGVVHDHVLSSKNYKFGNLNLIICTTQDEYDAWVNGTEECIHEASHSPEGYITRDKAKEIFQDWRQRLGVSGPFDYPEKSIQ